MKYNTPPKNVLQSRRRAAGLTQAQLAEKSGLPLRSIQGLERGIRSANHAAAINLYYIAKALKCKMEDLIDLEVEEGWEDYKHAVRKDLYCKKTKNE